MVFLFDRYQTPSPIVGYSTSSYSISTSRMIAVLFMQLSNPKRTQSIALILLVTSKPNSHVCKLVEMHNLRNEDNEKSDLKHTKAAERICFYNTRPKIYIQDHKLHPLYGLLSFLLLLLPAFRIFNTVKNLKCLVRVLLNNIQ